jgi:hypothetical protein
MGRPQDIPEDVWESLPRPAVTYADHSYPAYSREQMARVLLAERLKEREACAKLIEEGFERPVGEAQVPGHRSKNDYCPHQRFMYEDCEQCAAIAIRSRP